MTSLRSDFKFSWGRCPQTPGIFKTKMMGTKICGASNAGMFWYNQGTVQAGMPMTVKGDGPRRKLRGLFTVSMKRLYFNALT